MDAERYSRHVNMLCPTCGCSDFEEYIDAELAMVKCASCGRTMTKDELVRENYSKL
jgi:uncharacterized Zn finger protein